MNQHSVFLNYWARKKELSLKQPRFLVTRWFLTDDLCDIEKIYFKALEGCQSVLDVGAGDLRIKNKMISKGLNAEYHTQDVSPEFEHTYRSLDQVQRKYDAVLCLDVIEHMPFQEGLNLIEKMIGCLKENGVLIIQTPNGRCIRNPMSWDMTHQHIYNLPDLWALLTAQGFLVDGYRVYFTQKQNFAQKLMSIVGQMMITKFIGSDYADNIAIVAKRVK